MDEPLISIITVSYNAEATIERTIKSVVEQTYENIEYIVIDGGSTDGTLSIVNRYRNRIKIVTSEPDKGIYDAMNKGIARATGEWIHFKNCGDFFLKKDSLSLFFSEPVADNISVVHGNCIFFDKSGWYEQTPPSLRVSFKEQIPVLHPAAFIRTTLQKRMPFDLQYTSSADYDFFFKCCEQGLCMEYRPITIVAFEKGGFSSNWKRAYFEDKRIQGYMNSYSGRVKVQLLYSFKCMRLYYFKILHILSTIFKGRKSIGSQVPNMFISLPTDF